jgi:hypothetical protein
MNLRVLDRSPLANIAGPSLVKILITLICAMIIPTFTSGDELSREEREKFLKSAKVISIEEVGEGATRPFKLRLESGTLKMKAIYKTVDLRLKSPTRFGTETVPEYLDSYKCEIAAYELDKLLGLNLLPVTVERRIKGKRGSVREWVDRIVPHYGHSEPLPDMDLVQDQLHTVWLFDYLIYNLDRRTHNLMIGPGWSPVLIDHSMTFSTFERPFKPLHRFPKEVIQHLRDLKFSTIRKTLGPYLKRHQLKAFMRRRQIVLQIVDQQIEKRGESEVLFPTPN